MELLQQIASLPTPRSTSFGFPVCQVQVRWVLHRVVEGPDDGKAMKALQDCEGKASHGDTCAGGW